MLPVEAIQLAQHLRRNGVLPEGTSANEVILGLLAAIDNACDLKDRLVIDCRANKDEADALRAMLKATVPALQEHTSFTGGANYKHHNAAVAALRVETLGHA